MLSFEFNEHLITSTAAVKAQTSKDWVPKMFVCTDVSTKKSVAWQTWTKTNVVLRWCEFRWPCRGWTKRTGETNLYFKCCQNGYLSLSEMNEACGWAAGWLNGSGMWGNWVAWPITGLMEPGGAERRGCTWVEAQSCLRNRTMLETSSGFLKLD